MRRLVIMLKPCCKCDEKIYTPYDMYVKEYFTYFELEYCQTVKFKLRIIIIKIVIKHSDTN
jgi:hypothetical protein